MPWLAPNFRDSGPCFLTMPCRVPVGGSNCNVVKLKVRASLGKAPLTNLLHDAAVPSAFQVAWMSSACPGSQRGLGSRRTNSPLDALQMKTCLFWVTAATLPSGDSVPFANIEGMLLPLGGK